MWSQFSKAPGTPIIMNFTEEAVNNDLTTYDISQNQNGIMYFATPSGLLEFDGVRWENYVHRLESDLRAVLYKDAQHIYTAGHGGFGYWGVNNVGVLEYTRLFFKLPEKKAPLLPIFSRIIEIKGKIIFQSFFGKLLIISLSWSFSFHMLSEIRHLIWDLGYGFDLKISKITGIITIIGSLALTILIYLLGKNLI